VEEIKVPKYCIDQGSPFLPFDLQFEVDQNQLTPWRVPMQSYDVLRTKKKKNKNIDCRDNKINQMIAKKCSEIKMCLQIIDNGGKQ
jgi:hypothetical protein